MIAGHAIAQDWGVGPDVVVRVPGHVVYRAFPDQTVVLNLQSGQYHGLNGSAGVMFALLAAGDSLSAVAHAVSERYCIRHADAQRDLSKLCVSLLERGLVEPAEHAPA